ncbi:hypothetical protein [Chondromyces apiculatus]|uniref:Uncharacterized protein n=1 Tax=Chondromyces apiculatus DSM 436 TaxID=1192034 RepID=A0A017TF02_9BACT|nr:hypothetical protein [Chondromyces apiculatus]EYF07824.1 Hypothetical protein CAP_6846 [Chondromyces apiculatus DSM 436]
MKTMVSTLVGNIILVLHTDALPREEEWAKYIRLLSSISEYSNARSLVFTDGGAPSTKQRQQVNAILAGRPGRAVAISHNPLIRGAITALNMFNPLVRSYPPDKLADAYAHLKLTTDEIAAIHQALKGLYAELGVRLKCAPPELQLG